MLEKMHMDIPGRRQSHLLICLFLAILTLLVYWQVQYHQFLLWDDDAYIVENPHVRTGLTAENVLWAFTSAHSSNWHPLTWISHMLDAQLYGLNPGGHHWSSVLLHLANTVLLFLLLSTSTGAKWTSAFVAALFSLHPLHMESVAWVSERKDVLSTFFWMITLLAYVSYAKNRGGKGYALVLLFFILGLISKPMVVTLPFVLLLMDYWPLRRLQMETFRTARATMLPLCREKIPFFVLSACSGLVTFLVQKSAGAVMSDHLSLNDRLANAVVSYVGYITKTIWPSDLAFFYPHPMDSLSFWHGIGCLFLLGCITLIVVRLAVSRPYMIVGWLWYVGTLIPVIGLVQVGSQAMADRFTYIPQIGLLIIIAWGFRDLGAAQPRSRVPLLVLSCFIVLALAVVTHHQLQYWRDGMSLFSRAVRADPQNSRGHFLLGEELLRQGRIEEAISEYSESVRILPRETSFLNGLASALLRAGRVEEAIRHLREAVRVSPGDARILTSLGSALRQHRERDEALRCLKAALRIQPVAEAHHLLGLLFAEQGRYEEAISHYRQSLRIKPRDAQALNDFGVALHLSGKRDQALILLMEAFRLDPGNPGVRRNIEIVMGAREGRKEIEHGVRDLMQAPSSEAK